MLPVEKVKIDTNSEMIFDETEGTISVRVESDSMDENLIRLMNTSESHNFIDLYLFIDVLSELPFRWEIVSRASLIDKEDKLTILITDAREKVELYLKLKEQGGEEYSKLLSQSHLRMFNKTSSLEDSLANSTLEGLTDFYTYCLPFCAESFEKVLEDNKDEMKNYITKKISCDLDTSGHPLYENGRKLKLEAFYTWASVINSGIDERDFITMLVEEEGYGFLELSKYLGNSVTEHFMEVYGIN